MRVRQFAVTVGIMVLLPLLAYCAADLFSPPADWQKFWKYERRLNKAKNHAEKQALMQRKQKAKAALEAKDKRYPMSLFLIAYTIGLSAIVLSLVPPLHGVATGIMFGGICTVIESYFFWDKIPKELRFVTLILLLAVFIGLGCWKMRTATNLTVSGKPV